MDVNYFLRLAVKYIQEHLSISTEDLGKDSIINAAKTCMSSKVIGRWVKLSEIYKKKIYIYIREFNSDYKSLM